MRAARRCSRMFGISALRFGSRAFRQTVPVVKISFFCYRCISAVSYIVRIRPFGLPDARKGPEKCRLRILSATGNAPLSLRSGCPEEKACRSAKKMSILRMSRRRFSLIFRTGPRLRTERRLRRPFGLSRSFRDYARRKRRPRSYCMTVRGGGDSGVGVFRGRAVAGPRDKVDKTGWRGPCPEEAMDGPVVVRSERTRLEYRRVSGKGFEQGALRSVCPGAVFRAGCSCGRSTVLPEPYRASFWKSSGK